MSSQTARLLQQAVDQLSNSIASGSVGGVEDFSGVMEQLSATQQTAATWKVLIQDLQVGWTSGCLLSVIWGTHWCLDPTNRLAGLPGGLVGLTRGLHKGVEDSCRPGYALAANAVHIHALLPASYSYCGVHARGSARTASM
jgi:hypothetical protein